MSLVRFQPNREIEHAFDRFSQFFNDSCFFPRLILALMLPKAPPSKSTSHEIKIS